MDFNYLYHRRQVELMRADAAVCNESSKAHRGLAELYASLIRRRQEAVRPRIY